jgi:hypothetical protein
MGRRLVKNALFGAIGGVAAIGILSRFQSKREREIVTEQRTEKLGIPTRTRPEWRQVS